MMATLRSSMDHPVTKKAGRSARLVAGAYNPLAALQQGARHSIWCAMSLDLHRVLVRKQERECARIDAFAFYARARAWRRFGEWLREQVPGAPDPIELAKRIATETDDEIFDALLEAHGGDPRSWSRALSRAQAQAATELRAEMGDPTPHRLA
jgi:hypothetical protein